MLLLYCYNRCKTDHDSLHHFSPCTTAKPQWEFMHGLMENAIYGGRVDNTFDMRVLISYLEQCFNDIAITGQSATPTRTGKKVLSLPFGNIPVSLRTQVSMLYLYMYMYMYVEWVCWLDLTLA